MTLLKTQHVQRLPDESCRLCGKELKPWGKCQYCFKTIQQVCVNCKTFTSIQYHEKCHNLNFSSSPQMMVEN